MPLEGHEKVQNAAHATRNKVESVYAVNGKRICGGSQFTKMQTLSRNLVNNNYYFYPCTVMLITKRQNTKKKADKMKE